MLSFAVQMDLSSLEGPPISYNRFSNPTPSAASVPHIRLDDTFNPVSPLESNSWDLPPRPASANAIPPRSKYTNSGSNGFWQSIHPNDNNNNNNRTNFRSPPNQSLQAGASHGLSYPANTLSPPSRSSRPNSNSVSTPHQLIWLESEQIWVLTTRTTSPTPHQRPHQRPRPSRSSPGLTGAARSWSPSQSRNLYPPTDYLGDAELDDQPPPYEQHVFDQPLGPILPAVTRVRPEDVPHRGSQWVAIGRRVS
ncbi:hypothetical protein BJX76DRAFT_353912 [Aspergillus varians]